MRKWRGNHDHFRVGEVDLADGDAAEWPLPDDFTYIHMHKPFGDGVFCSALDRIIESLERRPCPLTLVYARPLLDSVVLANGRFRLIRVGRGLRRDLDSYRIHVHVSC